jgi:hypothetical protein
MGVGYQLQEVNMSVHAIDDDGKCLPSCHVCRAIADIEAAEKRWKSDLKKAKEERERREAKQPILDAFDRLSRAALAREACDAAGSADERDPNEQSTSAPPVARRH